MLSQLTNRFRANLPVDKLIIQRVPIWFLSDIRVCGCGGDITLWMLGLPTNSRNVERTHFCHEQCLVRQNNTATQLVCPPLL